MRYELVDLLEEEIISGKTLKITEIINNISTRVDGGLTFEESNYLMKLAEPQLKTRNTLRLLLNRR